MALDKLIFPIEPYTVGGYHFGERVRSRLILWARHLGDDIVAPAGTPVRAIGNGKVVWSQMRLGTTERRNWGGIIVLGHEMPKEFPMTNDQFPMFYSVYGHLRNLTIKVGDSVASGQQLGVIAPGASPENGWWKIPHLHFGIYIGPFDNKILPGYVRPFEGRTKFRWWREPSEFIEKYNALAAARPAP